MPLGCVWFLSFTLRATKIARSMVTKYGFSEKLGPVVYGHDETEVFLGRDYSQGRNYSENIAAEIDAEIRELIETSYEKAKDILENHIDQLHILAKYLMKNEKIDGADFEKLMKGEIDENYEKEKSDDAPKDTIVPEQAEKPEQNVQPEADDPIKNNLDNGMDPPIFKA